MIEERKTLCGYLTQVFTLYGITIRLTKIHHRFLKNMFEKSLLSQSHLIKFINID